MEETAQERRRRRRRAAHPEAQAGGGERPFETLRGEGVSPRGEGGRLFELYSWVLPLIIVFGARASSFFSFFGRVPFPTFSAILDFFLPSPFHFSPSPSNWIITYSSFQLLLHLSYSFPHLLLLFSLFLSSFLFSSHFEISHTR